MIVVDTSALMAVVLNEPEKAACMTALQANAVSMSAAGLLEAGIVATRRGVTAELERLLDGLPVEIAPVTAASARRAIDAYRRWGKGFHPARLNFGDCFAYELARSQDCPLLYVGEDFARTDIRAAITASP